MFLDGYKTDENDIYGREVMINAFLKRGDHNVINVNWIKIAGGNYLFDAFPNTRKVRCSSVTQRMQGVQCV
jgi:pancreatic triacylglycerol lipase